MPLILRLISMFKSAAESKVQRGLGHDQAVREALEEGLANLKKGDAAELAARKDHAAKPGDDAFDPEFMRKE